MMKMTFTQARVIAAGYGMVISRKNSADEYRVTIPTSNKDLAERLAYYTDNIQDALETARAMSQEPIRNDN